MNVYKRGLKLKAVSMVTEIPMRWKHLQKLKF